MARRPACRRCRRGGGRSSQAAGSGTIRSRGAWAAPPSCRAFITVIAAAAELGAIAVSAPLSAAAANSADADAADTAAPALVASAASALLVPPLAAAEVRIAAAAGVSGESLVTHGGDSCCVIYICMWPCGRITWQENVVVI